MRRSMMRLLAAAILATASATVLAEPGWEAGARWGASNTDGFHRLELFAADELPYHWAWHDWEISSELQIALGQLKSHGDSSGFFALGPALRFRGEPGSALSFSLGVSPTILPDHQYPTLDLGGALMFTTHLGVDYRLTPRLDVGYRMQHMSNAYLYDYNPGIDMHTLELGWRF